MQEDSIVFGEDWSGYIGHSDQSAPHVHVAVQVCIALAGDVTVHSMNQVHCGPMVIIAPFIEHTVAVSAEPVAYLYVYPDAPLGRALVRLVDQASVLLPGRELHEGLDASKGLAALVAELMTRVVIEQPLDVRLAKALHVLRDDWSGQGAVSRAAVASGLSGPRLRALARHEMGVPISQWIVWRKLERACRSLAAGADITQAAVDGMFADQAHFTRMMQRLIGISPARAANALRLTSESFKTPRN